MAERAQGIGVKPSSKKETAAENGSEKSVVIEISELKIYFPEYTRVRLRAVQKAAAALKAFDQGRDSSQLLPLLDKNPFLEEPDTKLNGKTPLAKLRELIQRGVI